MGVEARVRAVEERIAAANGLDVQERWVDVASPAVRVRVLESGTGYPVLFINGISAPGIGMAALAGRLPGRRLLLVDLPGHGLSPPYLWQGAPVREQAVNVIARVLDGLGVDQVTLVGNSLGGLFSLWFALDRPSRVARVVLVGQPAVAIAGSRGDRTMVVVSAPVLGRVATWMARLPSPRFIGRMGQRSSAGAHAARLVSDDIVDLHLLTLRLPGQAASFRSLLRRLIVGRTPRFENILTDAELASFTAPLLFVWPEDDRFLGPAAGKPSVDKIPPRVSSPPRAATSPGTTIPSAAPPSSPKACSRRTRLKAPVACGSAGDVAIRDRHRSCHHRSPTRAHSMDATTPDGITAELRRTRPSSPTSIETVERFVEHSDDATVSTLRRHLKAFGARLELVAVFDDEERRVPIHLGKEDPAA